MACFFLVHSNLALVQVRDETSEGSLVTDQLSMLLDDVIDTWSIAEI